MVLKFHDISKSYGKTRALQHFSVELSEGVYALLGPNGSGKTTLMNILTGNLCADAGKITFADGTNAPEDIAAMGKRFRKHLGFMPQYPGMYGNFTLEEFLWYIATLKDVGSDLSEKERKALIKAQIDGVLQGDRLLCRVGFGNARDRELVLHCGHLVLAHVCRPDLVRDLLQKLLLRCHAKHLALAQHDDLFCDKLHVGHHVRGDDNDLVKRNARDIIAHGNTLLGVKSSGGLV